MKEVLLDYGDSKLRVELPDNSMIVRYKETYTDPEPVDPYESTRKALTNPIGHKRLKDLAGPDKKVVIGFPDRVKGGFHKDSHRRVSIPMIIEELLAGGAKIENITLLCAMGLHRKNNVEEWYQYLGKEIVDQFYPDRLINHDAEDSANLLDFGTDEMGNKVECNRYLAEADIPVIIGHCAGNPYGGFSGGYKMLVTGHTGAGSIGSHHCPDTMYRDDWLGASTTSRMRKQFTSIGKAIENKIGKKIFAIDAVLNQYSRILKTVAGSIEDVEKATWPLAKERTNIELNDNEPYDVLVMGLPRNFHYGPGMGTNAILSGLAMGGQLSRCWYALNDDPVIIVTSSFDGWFNPHWFPSYEETFENLIKYQNAESFLASDDAKRIAMDYNYRWMYSNCYTYHPFHAMSMTSGYGLLKKRAKAIIMVGSKAPQYARAMGYIPVETFEEAKKMAARFTDKHARYLCTPECFTGGLPVHLFLKGQKPE